MARGDSERSGRDVKIGRRAGVGDANVDEGGGVREESEDVRTNGGADVGRFDLGCSAELLNEGSKMSDQAVVAEPSKIFEEFAGEEVSGLVCK